MALQNPFELHKLTIKTYEHSSRKEEKGTWTVMFNPASVAFRHESKFSKLKGINTADRRVNYTHSPSAELRLDLVLDGTGVTDFGISTLIGLGTQSVAEQIERFRNVCFFKGTDASTAKFLKIQWGEGVLKDFNCLLRSVDIEYTAFERNGAPLHAILKTTFVEDQDAPKKPDASALLHTRTVKDGDTLPLLAKAIYGLPTYYLLVAQANNLDDFRNLTPGQTIIFPPLEKEPQGTVR